MRPSLARRPLVATLAVTSAVAVLTSCGSATPAARPSAVGSAAGGAATAGHRVDRLAYVDEDTYRTHPSDYAKRHVALFFYAPWCPDCQGHDTFLHDALQAGSFPGDLTIVKVDYDSRTALEQRYGVTQQDTFVQVDSTGKALAAPLVSPPDSALLTLDV